ncbi:diguanylate cyclase (GGDEF) domain-containing protein [Pseudobutyrivibrio sp. JW11]|uniref:GGDEF domain-containing protein n=1 Tax=Pseudobutyrivibrio sp. JW11 TaxID=1855302 RepID=UPI0008F23A61|nr:diguanylate cyclase [Pseudobutyrivibrio sp. JW11]SFO00055.1 diguanylate cyclase (GGDEF) domain-containing protein [Pseudobutyrivibrio sp. JW11]
MPIKKLNEWIKKAPAYSEDSSSMISLVRYLLCAWIPYYCAILIYTIIRGYFLYSVVLSIAVVIYAIALNLSYKIRVRACAFIVILTTIASTYVLTYGFGWRCSFQNMIYIAFLVLWYDAMSSLKVKISLSLIITAIFLSLSTLTPFGGTILNPDSLEFRLLVWVNIIEFSICLSLTAYFYCTLYVDVERTLRINNKQLKLMSETDTLTGLMNRRFAQNELKDIEKAKDISFISIAIGDIDFFKNINDTYGHDCGDYVLSELAELFKSSMTLPNFVARWGGEEFLFVFVNKNGDEALLLLEDLRNKVRNFDFKYKDKTFNVTMTFGLEEYSRTIGTVSTIEAADKKLYFGKQAGRNRVVF